jgi:predicted nucleic acid-binding protein
MYVELSSSLGLGEASCLSVAISRGFVLATDDLAARREAAKRGVRLTGTLGVLIRLVREGHLSLTAANDILRQMIAWRYRSPVTSLDDLL